MVLLIDNYDSFSYNLVQLAGELTDGAIRVVRNDAVTVDEIKAIAPSALILSPGPGRPDGAGICEDAVKAFTGKIPILGVCLGHQCICEAFGAEITYAGKLMHGKQSDMVIDTDCPLFKGLPGTIKGARYHSLAVKADTLPETLEVCAADSRDNEIMAVRHKTYDIYGLQFHPESVLTPDGKTIVRNFLQTCNWRRQ